VDVTCILLLPNYLTSHIYLLLEPVDESVESSPHETEADDVIASQSVEFERSAPPTSEPGDEEPEISQEFEDVEHAAPSQTEESQYDEAEPVTEAQEEPVEEAEFGSHEPADSDDVTATDDDFITADSADQSESAPALDPELEYEVPISTTPATDDSVDDQQTEAKPSDIQEAEPSNLQEEPESEEAESAYEDVQYGGQDAEPSQQDDIEPVTPLVDDDEVVVEIDPRHGPSKPVSEEEAREKSEKRREALMSLVADLDAASPEIEICDITQEDDEQVEEELEAESKPTVESVLDRDSDKETEERLYDEPAAADVTQYEGDDYASSQGASYYDEQRTDGDLHSTDDTWKNSPDPEESQREALQDIPNTEDGSDLEASQHEDDDVQYREEQPDTAAIKQQPERYSEQDDNYLSDEPGQ